MLLNCCLIINLKEKSKFLLKIWRMSAFKVNFISALFKLVLIKSIKGPLLDDPEYKVEYNLDFKHWYFKFMFDALSGKFFLLSTIVLALCFHIEGLDHVDAALTDIVEDTDEERRPILKLEENIENKITNNGSPVHVPAKVCKISAKTVLRI